MRDQIEALDEAVDRLDSLLERDWNDNLATIRNQLVDALCREYLRELTGEDARNN